MHKNAELLFKAVLTGAEVYIRYAPGCVDFQGFVDRIENVCANCGNTVIVIKMSEAGRPSNKETFYLIYNSDELFIEFC